MCPLAWLNLSLVTCLSTWKSRLVYWPAWACSSVPSLDRVRNTRPRYHGFVMVTSFFKSHQRTLLPRKRCGCGITEMESKSQNFSKRELLQPFIYTHTSNSLQLRETGNTGNDRKMLTGKLGNSSEWMTKHCNTRHVSSLFIIENQFMVPEAV